MVIILKGRLIKFLIILLVIQLINSLNSRLEKFNRLRKLQLVTIPTTIFSTSISSTTTSGNSTIAPVINLNKSSGLSSGAICAIAIPCIAALIAVGALAALCRASPTPPIQQRFPIEMNYMETSLDKLRAPTKQVQILQNVPIQQSLAVQQPVAVVQQPVAVVQQPVAVVQQPIVEVQQAVPVQVQQVQPLPVTHVVP